jgi:hypothetical protein
VNSVQPRFGTPAGNGRGEAQVQRHRPRPFYDVLLGRPDIDLVAPGLDGRPVLVNLRKWYAKRAELVERAEALLTERGVPLAEPTA